MSPDVSGPASTRAPVAAGDHDFLAFADRSRDLLRGCALLLVGDAERADRLAGSVLARRGGHASRGTDRWPEAWADLVRPRPASFEPPWSPSERVQLVDGRERVSSPLLTELQRLPAEPRAALVLGQYAGLPAAEVAVVLQTSVATVEMWAQQAVACLAEARPERRQPGLLAEELRATAEQHLASRPSGSALTDLAHARQLVRRGRLRKATVLVAAVLVVVLGTVTVVRSSAPAPEAAALPSVSAPPTLTPVPTASHSGVVTARCDINNPSCQATVMRDWRTTMARVAASHLDPRGRYFTGYSFSYDRHYETPSFWKGGDGALGLDVYRLSGGATEVYLQIATGYDQAVRCGQTTDQTCTSMRFMDGNRFTLSEGTRVSDGIEVQYRPDGDQVITAVARNTVRGKPLEISRGDLINLVQDPRLRLPVI